MKNMNLDPEQPYCPPDCPFLSPRFFLPDTLPFYCDKYETYLTATDNRANRCDQCRGITKSVSAKGLQFIQTLCPGNLRLMAAFKSLKKTEQKMLVDLIQKTGLLSVLPMQEESSADVLLDHILLTYQNHEQKIGTPEFKKFSADLNKIADDNPTLLSRQNKTLLMNLFQVLDNSEKSMMNALFQSPGRLESFLKQFDHQPKDMDLLKDTRRILYEENDKLVQEKAREQEKTKNTQRQLDIQQIKQLKEQQRQL